jgi:hypothetical protein
MRKDGEYDWLLSKIPGWKTYTAVKASVQSLLARYRKVKTFLVSIPPYLRSNKRYIAKYSMLYLLLWSAEWSLGIPIELVILGCGGCCFFIDFYIKAIRPFKPSLALSALRRRGALKKKAFRKQKPSFVIWSTFYVEVGRFLANPTLRIVKTKAAGLFNYMWLVAFVGAFLDFLLCPPLMAWLAFVPPTYSDHERLMELMVSGFFIDNGMDYSQSHVIN